MKIRYYFGLLLMIAAFPLFIFAQNRLPVNGDFEAGLDFWHTGTFGSYTLPDISVDCEDVFKGSGAVRLSAETDNTRGWIEQFFPVQPETRYSVEAYIKALNVSYNRFGIQIIEYAEGSKTPLTLDIAKTLPIQIGKNSHDWTFCSGTFATGPMTDRIAVRAYIGTHGPVAQGASAWVDNLVVRSLGSAAAEYSQESPANGSFERKQTSSAPHWENGAAASDWRLWVPEAGEALSVSLDETEKTDGMYSVKITSKTKSRLCLYTETDVDPGKLYRLSMEVKTAEVMGKGVYFRVQYSSDGKKYRIPQNFKGSLPSVGTSGWHTQAEMLRNIPEDTKKIKIEIFFDSSVGTAWIDAVSFKESYEFSLSHSGIKKMEGKKTVLAPVFGDGNKNRVVEWSSSDDSVAVVDSKGCVTAVKAGAAVISARAADGNTAICVVSVEHAELKKHYALLRQRWFDRLTYGQIHDKRDSDFLLAKEQLDIDAKIRWDYMHKSAERRDLWTQYNTAQESESLTGTLADLRILARAYASEDSRWYRNSALKADILSALDWFYENRYNEKVETQNMYGNWWDWTIGTPQKLCDILILLYDRIPEKKRISYINAIEHFTPEPSVVLNGPNPLTGANLLDAATVCVLAGCIEENNRKVLSAVSALDRILTYVQKGDGFYEDGSFIQHTVFPYTGAYGAVTLAGVENLLYVLADSYWAVPASRMAIVFEWVEKAFMPLFYRGAVMDMVSGRSVARPAADDHTRGKALLARILALARFAPDPAQARIYNFVKANIVNDQRYIADTDKNYFMRMNQNDAAAFKTLLADLSVSGEFSPEQCLVYAGMDRVVHRRPNYVLGLSLFSSRTGAFEVGNGENKRGWHTAEGVTYLYNGDGLQFCDNYWASIDMHRLPGITTDSSERTNRSWSLNTGSKDWVGGSVLFDLYGAAGMDFEAEPGKSSLRAKKSWFMFDNEIVCLGSDISAADGRMVETIVDNRKLKNSGTNRFCMDGTAAVSRFGTATFSNPRWAWLEGNSEDGTDSFGYYFPQPAAVSVERNLRTGNWFANTDYGSENDILKNFFTISIPHGVNPRSRTYQYVLLPCLPQESVRAYSESPDVTVLQNSETVHAVYEKSLSIIAANFWQADSLDTQSAQNCPVNRIGSLQPCSLLFSYAETISALAVSDPTQLQAELMIELEGRPLTVSVPNDLVSAVYRDGKTIITIRTEKSGGKTYCVFLEEK
ncbi:polysaccharide lyase family 8 super-sandwich domain-containing protein [Treponema brennaborense]|uniref:Hyaluronate lyase n=1 Tax=Treponema brennaborense (strain DSM 12168 / CIP 105900 / DD5/3) TaxID=906968 RepID=F4LPB5_TREBD|nr:polysaccharide lyase family 8 super-sandwich domain-containing protein [Treponema brennaborense]AEE16977.1 Hyaluronate lyase [Treponema brennaborense DSM 12168]